MDFSAPEGRVRQAATCRRGLKILTKLGRFEFRSARRAAIRGRVQPCPICFIEVPAQDWHGEQLLIPNANLRDSEVRSFKVQCQRKECRRKRSCENFAIGEKAEGRIGELSRLPVQKELADSSPLSAGALDGLQVSCRSPTRAAQWSVSGRRVCMPLRGC
jgi:hypothetical protein